MSDFSSQNSNYVAALQRAKEVIISETKIGHSENFEAQEKMLSSLNRGSKSVLIHFHYAREEFNKIPIPQIL